MLFGSGASGRCLGHEDGALMNWISALITGDSRELSCSLSTM